MLERPVGWVGKESCGGWVRVVGFSGARFDDAGDLRENLLGVIARIHAIGAVNEDRSCDAARALIVT